MTSRDDFLKERLTGIGGSDSAAALGVSKWRSPIELWKEKRGEAPPFEGNEFTYWGTALESAITQRYATDTGAVVTKPTAAIRYANLPYMIAHPDGITDTGRLLEVKCSATGTDFGEPGSDQIPMEHLIQVQHNMVVVGLIVADVAVLIAGHDYRRYEVRADPELQEMIVEGEAEFWKCVQAGEPPEIDPNDPRALQVIKHIYPGTDGTTLFATEQLEHWRQVWNESRVLAQQYENARALAESHIRIAMKEAAEMQFQDGARFTRKLVKIKEKIVAPYEYIDFRLKKPKE